MGSSQGTGSGSSSTSGPFGGATNALDFSAVEKGRAAQERASADMAASVAAQSAEVEKAAQTAGKGLSASAGVGAPAMAMQARAATSKARDMGPEPSTGTISVGRFSVGPVSKMSTARSEVARTGLADVGLDIGRGSEGANEMRETLARNLDVKGLRFTQTPEQIAAMQQGLAMNVLGVTRGTLKESIRISKALGPVDINPAQRSVTPQRSTFGYAFDRAFGINRSLSTTDIEMAEKKGVTTQLGAASRQGLVSRGPQGLKADPFGVLSTIGKLAFTIATTAASPPVGAVGIATKAVSAGLDIGELASDFSTMSDLSAAGVVSGSKQGTSVASAQQAQSRSSVARAMSPSSYSADVGDGLLGGQPEQAAAQQVSPTAVAAMSAKEEEEEEKKSALRGFASTIRTGYAGVKRPTIIRKS